MQTQAFATAGRNSLLESMPNTQLSCLHGLCGLKHYRKASSKLLGIRHATAQLLHRTTNV